MKNQETSRVRSQGAAAKQPVHQKIKKTKDVRLYEAFTYPFIGLLVLLALLPMVMILIASFTDNHTIVRDGYTLFPSMWSVDAYRYIFSASGDLVRSYGVTIYITLVGTAIGLLMTSMAGYVLNRKDFKYRNKFSFFFYFTTLFSGGLVPFYIVVTSVLGLTDNLWAVILPGLTTPFLIILMRSFVSSLPDALTEAMQIDGAGDFRIYASMVMPLSTPALATIGLFLALSYWNGWYYPMLFLNHPADYPLQYYLYNMLTVQQMAAASGASGAGVSFPAESVKMAMAVMATGPIVLAYPFVQRYFVKGLTIGAVKG